MKTALTLLLALCTAMPTALHAQTVWRCGPDGRTFTDAPCPQGQMLDVAASRPAEDVHSAQQLAQRERTWGQQLQRERQQREAQATAGPAGIYGLRPVKALPEPKARLAKKHPKQRFEAADTWQSTGPSIRRKKG
jgi:hypothetical protein